MSETDDRGPWQDAVEWRIRLRHGSAEMWEAFTLWLESAPENAAAYDAVALADSALDTPDVSPDAPARLDVPDVGARRDGMAPSRRPLRTARWMAPFAAIAALLLVAIFSYPMLIRGRNLETIATAPGEARAVALADGTRIDMNGATRLVLDRNRPRFASLEAGEATFHVVHNEADPFTVTAGDATLRDVGTLFNVVREQGRLDVGVAEGAIVYNPGGEAIRLPAGRRLRVARDGDMATVGPIAPDAVGAWRKGRLIYDGAPLGIVAAEISRTIGAPVSVDPAIAGQSFTGVIRIGHDRRAFFASLGGLLGVKVARQGDGWRLSAGGRADR